MSEKDLFEKDDIDEILDKSVEKGKNVAGRVATDLGKTMEEIMINLKSLQKDVDSKINEYKEASPTKIDLDLIDAGDSLYVKADLPGIEKENIDIELQDRELTIKSNFGSSCKNNEEENKCEFIIKGRKSGPAERTIKIPYKIKTKEAKAEFSNGVLFLELPKVESKKLKVDIK